MGYRQTFGKDFSPWRETHVEAFGPDGESLGVVFDTTTPFETPGWMKDLVDWFNRFVEEETGANRKTIKVHVKKLAEHSDSLNELTGAEDKNLTACRLTFQALQSISPPK